MGKHSVRFLVLLTLLWGGLLLSNAARGEERQSPFRIVGYLPDYRLRKFDPEQAARFTDLILFAAEPTRDGGIDLGKWNEAPWERLHEAKNRHGVRLFLCLGGWGHSDHFVSAVVSAETRRRLVDSAVTVLRQHQLDGLDLDWEHPRGEEELAAYALLLEELKTAFRPHGLQLSLTLAPWKHLPAGGYAAADWIQLMSYDYGGRHSTPEQAHKDIQAFLDRSIPPGKLVLGMPFYGRDIEDRTKTITYSEVQRRFQPASNIDEVNGYYFNGPLTIRRKTRLAIQAQLGGVMVWEIGQDAPDEFSLLRAIQLEQTSRSWKTPVRSLPRRVPSRD